MVQKPKRGLVCFCNGVPRAAVEEAIRQGHDTLGKLFDETTAGVGACGGSCQPELKKMLDQFLETGTFPPEPSAKKRTR